MDISKMFFTLSENKKISRDEMTAFGITNDYISFALENDILRELDETSYEAGDLETLIEYGKYVTKQGDEKTAFSVFNYVYTAAREDYNINLRLLHYEITSATPSKGNVFKYFDHVYKKLVENNRQYDADYYLFIIGSIVGFYKMHDDEIGEKIEKYGKIFNKLEEKDILMPFTDKNTYHKNLLRKNIFFNVYYTVDKTYARTLPYVENDFEKVFERDLVIQWLKKKKYITRKIHEFLKYDNIKEARELLKKHDMRRGLTKTNQYILRILDAYATIEKTEIVPTSNYSGDNVFEAIEKNNFRLALELEKTWIKEHNVNNGSYLPLALKKIVALIDKVEKVKTTTSNDDVSKEIAIEVKKPVVVTLTDEEKKSIMDKVEKLRNGRTIFLLDSMPKEKRDAVRKFLQENGCTDVTAFAVGVDPKRQIYLRYHPQRTGPKIDFGEVYAKAKAAYAKRDYETAIQCYETIIQIGRPNEFAFSGYGMALYKTKRFKEAVDALTISTIMSQTEGTGIIDYTDRIFAILHPKDVGEVKPVVVMSENAFDDDNKSQQDEMINTLVALMNAEGLSLVDACKKLGFTAEQTNYCKLLYARDCYYKDNETLGNEYLRQVEKSKAKDKRVKDTYNEIKINKKYYPNRLDENKSQLVFVKK